MSLSSINEAPKVPTSTPAGLNLSSYQMRHRWWALGVVALSYILSFFQRFAPAGIAQDLASTFQISATSLGALASTYFYVYTITQIPTGVLVDTLGPRRILAWGGLIGGLGSLMFGFAPTFTWALVGRTLIGLGVSVTFIAMLKLIAVWFEERRFATLVGVCLLIGNLGSALAGSPLSGLAQSTGWRTVFVVVGLVSVVLGGLSWWVVRDAPSASEQQGPVQGALDFSMAWQGLVRVASNRETWPAALVTAGISGSFFTFVGLWGTPYLVQVHGMSRALASEHLSMWAIGFAIGCFFIGTLSDRLGRRKPVMVVAAHAYALSWLVLWSCVRLPVVVSYVFFVWMGVLTAAFTLAWACAKEVNPPKLSGMSTSVANMGGFLAAALMQPFVGWVMDFGWRGTLLNGARAYDVSTWRYGLTVMCLLAVLGALATWWLRETGCRNVWQDSSVSE